MDSGSSPPVPNAREAARETAAGDLAAARYATTANRPDEYTPLGSRTWKQIGATRTFDQSAYDKALSDYNANVFATTSRSPFPQQVAGEVINGDGTGAGAAGLDQSNRPPPPDASMFWRTDGGDRWESRIELTPEAQRLFDQDLRIKAAYGDIAESGLGQLRESVGSTGIDMTKAPTSDAAFKAIMARLQPDYQRREEELRTRLANQGIAAGSDAYGKEYDLMTRARNDAELQAAAMAEDLAMKQRANYLQEQSFLQDRPLNLINALRSGSQVALPQFQAYFNQATTKGPDYMQAASMDYQGALNSYNADRAADASTMGAIGSMLMMISDIRLKRDIVRIGTHKGLGVGVYLYRIFGRAQIGVIAQELERVLPSAVITLRNGFKAVNYGAL